MSSVESKAKVLISLGLVKVEANTRNAIYFKVKDYDVYYRKDNFKWNCVCEFSSAWVGDTGRACHHIVAAKLYLEEWKKKKLYQKNIKEE